MMGSVLLTDAQERSAAAACRILRNAGYWVGAAASANPAPGLWSRYCSERFKVPDPREDDGGFAREIAEIVAHGSYAAVLPGTDASLLAISRHRSLFGEHFDLGLPSEDVVEACVDKVNLLEVSARAGLAPPETVVCEGIEDARAAAATFGFPLLVKPRCTVFEYDGRMRQRGSRLVWKDAELEERIPEFGSRCLLQRRNSGRLMSFAGVIADERLLGMVLSRYRRTWPPDAGSVSFSETVEIPESLIKRIESFLIAMKWKGIFEIELIQDGPENFAVIDFNPRLYGSLALAAQAGVPLPAIWCDWLFRRDITVRRAGSGFHYRWEDAELRHVIQKLRKGRLRAVASIVQPHRRSAHAFFRWDDPGPLAARVIGAVRHSLQMRANSRAAAS